MALRKNSLLHATYAVCAAGLLGSVILGFGTDSKGAQELLDTAGFTDVRIDPGYHPFDYGCRGFKRTSFSYRTDKGKTGRGCVNEYYYRSPNISITPSMK